MIDKKLMSWEKITNNLKISKIIDQDRQKSTVGLFANMFQALLIAQF